MNLLREIDDFQVVKREVFMLQFDLNQITLEYIYSFSKIIAFDDPTGAKGAIQYSGSKQAFYTGSKNMVEAIKKVSKAAGIRLRVKKTKLLFKKWIHTTKNIKTLHNFMTRFFYL